jgi:hypothetical protein
MNQFEYVNHIENILDTVKGVVYTDYEIKKSGPKIGKVMECRKRTVPLKLKDYKYFNEDLQINYVTSQPPS